MELLPLFFMSIFSMACNKITSLVILHVVYRISLWNEEKITQAFVFGKYNMHIVYMNKEV